MVLPVKIFEIQEDAELGIIYRRLKDFHEEEKNKISDDKTATLITEVLDLKEKEGLITASLSRDFIRKRLFRRDLVEDTVTEEAHFWIKPFEDRMFLIVLAPSVARGVKKLLTNYVANKLSEIIFNTRAIVEVRISNDTLRGLHESNSQATKLIWFDDVDIPSVEKLCLAGSGLADTPLYHDYIKHGKIWYVVFEVRKREIVVGITRNCVVTLFSKSSVEDFIDYILEDILGLIT